MIFESRPTSNCPPLAPHLLHPVLLYVLQPLLHGLYHQHSTLTPGGQQLLLHCNTQLPNTQPIAAQQCQLSTSSNSSSRATAAQQNKLQQLLTTRT